MMLKWRKTSNGNIADPVGTPWNHDIVYEIYAADPRTYGRHHWTVLKRIGDGPRYALRPVQSPLAAAKELAEADLVVEKSWQDKADRVAWFLERLTGREWSLRKGKGTSASNIYVSSPPDRKQDRFGTLMAIEDRQLLAAAFALSLDLVGSDMVMIGPEQYHEYLTRLKRDQ